MATDPSETYWREFEEAEKAALEAEWQADTQDEPDLDDEADMLADIAESADEDEGDETRLPRHMDSADVNANRAAQVERAARARMADRTYQAGYQAACGYHD